MKMCDAAEIQEQPVWKSPEGDLVLGEAWGKGQDLLVLAPPMLGDAWGSCLCCPHGHHRRAVHREASIPAPPRQQGHHHSCLPASFLGGDVAGRASNECVAIRRRTAVPWPPSLTPAASSHLPPRSPERLGAPVPLLASPRGVLNSRKHLSSHMGHCHPQSGVCHPSKGALVVEKESLMNHLPPLPPGESGTVIPALRPREGLQGTCPTRGL